MKSPLSILEYEEEIARKSGLPLMVDNDANMQALGEYRARKLKNDDFAYISAGTGLGAGIILDGKLRHGANYQCGEIGYMVFDEHYQLKRDEPGWLETMVNLQTLERKFGQTGSAADMIEYAAGKIALCVANVAPILDCGTVCLGGVLVDRLGQGLIDRVREKLEAVCAVSVSLERTVCAEPGVVGGATCVIDQRIPQILCKG